MMKPLLLLFVLIAIWSVGAFAAPTLTVEGIASSHLYYGPTWIRAYTDGARVEFQLAEDAGDYAVLSNDTETPFAFRLDLNLHPGVTAYKIKIIAYAAGDASSTEAEYTAITYTNYERIGEGCTTAYFIDRDCDGYGVGVGFLNGTDADDKNELYNTLASAEAVYGDLRSCTGTDESCAARLLSWFSARIDRAYSGKSGGVYYVLPGATGGTKNRVQDPYPTVVAAWNAGASAGDALVVLRAGVYADQAGTSAAFTADTELVHVAMPGELPEFTPGSTSWYFPDFPNTVSYMTWDTIYFHDYSSAPFYGSGGYNDHVTFRNLEIFDTYYAFRIHSVVTNELVEYCVIRDAGNHGSYMQYNSCMGSEGNPSICSGDVYRGVIAYQTNDSTNGPLLQWGSWNYTDNYWSGLLIDRCIIHGSGNRGLTFEQNHVGTTVQNSVFFNNNGTDIQWYVYIACARGSQSPALINNTFYRGSTNNGHHGLTDAPTVWMSVVVANDSADFPDHAGGIIRNNLWHVYGGPSIIDVNDSNNISGWTVDHNIFYRETGTTIATIDTVDKNSTDFEAYVEVSNDSYTIPNLKAVNVAYYSSPWLFNLGLTNTSHNAVTHGLITLAPTVDITNMARGSAIDIGAYEWESATTPPAKPTGVVINP